MQLAADKHGQANTLLQVQSLFQKYKLKMTVSELGTFYLKFKNLILGEKNASLTFTYDIQHERRAAARHDFVAAEAAKSAEEVDKHVATEKMEEVTEGRNHLIAEEANTEAVDTVNEEAFHILVTKPISIEFEI